jgi:hypothetical protein
MWSGNWIPQEYQENSMVFDDGWLMIANTTTSEKAAPTPVGDPFFVYDGLAPTTSNIAKNIVYGTRYTWTQSGYIKGFRINVVAGNTYNVSAVADPGGVPIVTPIITFTADQTGWIDLNADPRIILPGTVFDLVVAVSEPDPSPSIFTGNWDYDTPVGTTAPTSGQIVHAGFALDRMEVHKTDNDGTDRATELSNLTVGDVINGAGMSWAIQGIIDNTSYYTFFVAPSTQGAPDGVQQFSFESTVSTPITYVEDPAYWAGNMSVQGFIAVDGGYGDITVNDNAYGIDLLVQNISASGDWDVMALSNTVGGTGPGP